MSDCFSNEVRSRVMSKIKSKNTTPEIRLRKYLWHHGGKGYRKNYKKLIGSPDIVYVSKKIAIFIDGCFWHGCTKCRYLKPKSNVEFWKSKIQKNIQRDEKVTSKLEKMEWTVIRIWEHEIDLDLDRVGDKILEYFG